MKRPVSLTTLLGATLVATAPAALAQAPTASVLERGQLYLQAAERVSPRVHVLRQRKPNFAGVVGNVAVIEQTSGLVLVDAGASHGSGARIVELVRAISPKPVTTVVITHWHGDHLLGLSAILAAWPGAEVIAHERAAADIASRLTTLFPSAPSADYERERRQSLEAAYADLEKRQAAEASTDAEREGWRATLGTRDLRLADVAGTHVVVPKRTFADSMTLADPATPVTLRFLGRANTSGDVVAWIPSDRVLVAGDIVVEPTPYLIQVYPADLIETLGRLREFAFAALIPGHGAPQRDRQYLDRLVALIRSVRDRVGPLAKAGVPLDSIPTRARFDQERAAFAGSNAWLAYWFDLYGLTPLIESVYNEALGRPLGPR
ncbi:MAG: MBL fold metallo-hydrolase [Gemmatimonadales bacterium]|nr:MBL fold metallo-hydrolase [Gemmatimonadales bacterium]